MMGRGARCPTPQKPFICPAGGGVKASPKEKVRRNVVEPLTDNPLLCFISQLTTVNCSRARTALRWGVEGPSAVLMARTLAAYLLATD